MSRGKFLTACFVHLYEMDGRQLLLSYKRLGYRTHHNLYIAMLTYHKIFKATNNLSICLSNPEPIAACNDEFLLRLTEAKNKGELHEAKVSILKDFQTIYAFDVTDAEFPEPVGHFSKKQGEDGFLQEKREFVKKRILLQDVWFYLGNTFGEYHVYKINTEGSLPVIEGKRLAINYREIYCKALEDYVETIRNGNKHAIAASFILPALIEQSLGMTLQNRMLRKCMAEVKELSEEESKLLTPFHGESHIFYGSEEYIMGKVYKLFVRKGVLKDSPDNEIILTGSSRRKRRTLGGLISSRYAKEEMLPEYYELMKDIFIKLNIRNCIMHGLGESFDYLDRGIAAIIFQLLWDISGGEVFQAEV